MILEQKINMSTKIHFLKRLDPFYLVVASYLISENLSNSETKYF